MTAVALPQPGDLALTIKQPWASLIMAGVKDVENRTWPVPKTLPQWTKCAGCAMRWAPGDGPPFSYEHWHGSRRGWMERTHDGPLPFRLWVHAGATWADGWTRRPIASGKLGYTLHHPTYGDQGWIGSDQLGVLLGSVLVTGCHPADDCWRWNPIAPDAGKGGKPIAKDGERPGWCSPWAEHVAYHWTLTDPQPLAEPIPMRGRQKLWRITADDLTAVTA